LFCRISDRGQSPRRRENRVMIALGSCLRLASIAVLAGSAFLAAHSQGVDNDSPPVVKIGVLDELTGRIPWSAAWAAWCIDPPVAPRIGPVPFELNQDRRHHIPRQRHKVTNWSGYEASLRRRGSLTVWCGDDAIAAWTAELRTTRGGQA
jgi:hypothetical protein